MIGQGIVCPSQSPFGAPRLIASIPNECGEGFASTRRRIQGVMPKIWRLNKSDGGCKKKIWTSHKQNNHNSKICTTPKDKNRKVHKPKNITQLSQIKAHVFQKT